MALPIADTGFCAELSVEAGESIVGTAASDTGAFLLLEVNAAWAPKAFEQADLRPALREHLQGWLDAVPGLRPQLIRRPGRTSTDAPTVMLASSVPGAAGIVRVPVSDLDALVEVDGVGILEAIRRGERPPGALVPDRPIVLVCTHGKRDRCCAKWGTPVYETLAARSDVEVWQTSHLGGHRFAATMLLLPEGICYGRLDPARAGAAVDDHLAGRIHDLQRLRGRTALSAVQQAAEHFARERTGAMQIDGVRITSVEQGSGGSWWVNVEVQGRQERLHIERAKLDSIAPGSCGKAPEPVAVFRCIPS